jgi:hypothetical protein
MREKALNTQKGATYQLLEVKFGNYPFDGMRLDKSIRAGAPISWNPKEIQSGKIEVMRLDVRRCFVGGSGEWVGASWIGWWQPAHGRLSTPATCWM